ncbi:MAG TPA: carbohydrate ABC transporter permease [Ktedonobacteraceae bacterium]|nr:carbohydrate ABC transporter permease [Ktedonobacteraceae bacterium]
MSTVNPVEPGKVATIDLASTSGRSVTRKTTLKPRQRVLRILNSGIVTLIVVILAVVWSVPTLGLLVSSFRPGDLVQNSGWWSGLTLPWRFTLDDYQQVLTAQGMGRSFLNSLIIAIPGTILPVLVAAFAAYAFAWMKFPGRDWIFIVIVGLLVVPIQITLIPILQLFTSVNLTGSYLAIWLAHTAYGLPFSVYLLRNFFGELPADLFESAHIDGASHTRIFFRLVLPLSVPALASLIIFQFMWVWNDLLVALVVLGGNPASTPMTVTIANMVNSTTSNSNFQVLASAAFVSAILPLIIFFALQRYFVRGILAGSVKG